MPFQKWMIERCLYPAMERRRGNRVRAVEAELLASERLAPEALRAMQAERLTALLLLAKAGAPAYRDLPLTDDEIRADPFAALRKIPPLTKQAFRADAERYLTRPKEGLIPNRTGGSTGDPVRFYMDRQQAESYEAARWRGLSWYGVTQGSRSIMIWGSPIELDALAGKKEARREKLLKNREVVSAYDLTPETARALAREIDRYRPEYLYGYSGALVAAAGLLDAQGFRPKRPLKAVVSTSETLTADGAALLKKVFSCPVANEYGARDAGILAYSCPEGRLHLTAENAVIEILDPITLEPVPDGVSGLIAVTDLHNFCMPRLRYLLGDAGTLSASPCACGRTLPVLASIEGREDAILVARGGALVHGNAIRQLVKAYDGVGSFQLEQLSPEQAVLRLKLLPGFTAADPALLDKIRGVLPGVEIETRYVDDIPPEKSGKFRCAVRRFPLK